MKKDKKNNNKNGVYLINHQEEKLNENPKLWQQNCVINFLVWKSLAFKNKNKKTIILWLILHFKLHLNFNC